MVALDDGSDICAGFNHVGIDRTLSQIVNRADLLALFLKDADKLLTDDLSLALGIGYASQAGQEAILGIDADKVDAAVAEYSFDLIAFILAHQAMVYKDAGELTAHCLGDQRSHNRAVHTAGQSQQHLAITNLGTDLLNGSLGIVLHGPVAGGAAHIVQEVPDHGSAVFSQGHFRMELHAIELGSLIVHGSYGAAVGMGSGLEALGQFIDGIIMAHERIGLFSQTGEDGAVSIKFHRLSAIFTDMARLYSTAQSIGHHLYAIADTQDRDSHFKDFLFQSGSAFLINTAGTTGENNTDGREFPDLLQGHIVGMDFTIHIAFPHSACDELIVLTAEIQNKDLLIFHTLPCLSI